MDVLENELKEKPSPANSFEIKLKLVRVRTALKQFPQAQELAEEILRLQPEGRFNAEARHLLGEIFFAQKKYDEAGKYFISVGVLYDDPDLTPKSLSRAIQTFQILGESNQVQHLQQELQNKYPAIK